MILHPQVISVPHEYGHAVAIGIRTSLSIGCYPRLPYGVWVRLEDLDLAELLDRPVGGGPLWFAGQRTLLLDATALGLLRKELIELMGLPAARGLLTRLGYAHGWRTAESLESAFDWKDRKEWQEAGGRLHGLQGLVDFRPVPDDRRRHTDSLAEAIWHHSYEAEQHVLHLGQHHAPVCWTLAGFASGYLSRAHGTRVYCREERCMGQGDALCWMVGRPADQWDDAELHAAHEDICLQDTLRTVSAALREGQPRTASARSAVTDDGTQAGLVAYSESMRELCDLARRAARVDVPVLITGESGTGKERIARLLHDASPRAAGPFIVINCAAIPENLLEGELFGHAAGAFTGATTDRIGLFEAAQRGTLFLDEIGEVSLAMQVKLLRVLQEQRIRRLGENNERPIDARIVSATNRDLPQAIETGIFRQDLYYRLRVVELQLAPLRERPDDILPLARHFLHQASERLGIVIDGLTPEAADRLVQYRWPGNVRELENAVERAIVVTNGPRIGVEDMPPEIQATPATPITQVDETLEAVEKSHILRVVDAHDGHRGRAATVLGIGEATLYRKLKKYRADERAIPNKPHAG